MVFILRPSPATSERECAMGCWMWSGCALRRENVQKKSSVADAQQLRSAGHVGACIAQKTHLHPDGRAVVDALRDTCVFSI
jgi:hypothetical protein